MMAAANPALQCTGGFCTRVFDFHLSHPKGQLYSRAGLGRLSTHLRTQPVNGDLRTQPVNGRAGIQTQVFACQAVWIWCVIVGTVDVLERERGVCTEVFYLCIRCIEEFSNGGRGRGSTSLPSMDVLSFAPVSF